MRQVAISLNMRRALDSAFSYYSSLGVHTVKTGYAGGFKGGIIIIHNMG